MVKVASLSSKVNSETTYEAIFFEFLEKPGTQELEVC
jgi:hypothetical protein